MKEKKTINTEEEDTQDRDEKKYDLEERTAVFGERIIDFAKSLPDDVINRELIRQLVKAGTSVGLITVRQMVQSQRKTSGTRLQFVRRSQKNLGTG